MLLYSSLWAATSAERQLVAGWNCRKRCWMRAAGSGSESRNGVFAVNLQQDKQLTDR